jgi:cell wall-associated NlpC family hydrolase
MPEFYKVGKVGTLKDREEIHDLDVALGRLRDSLNRISRPYRIRRSGQEPSQERDMHDTIERVRDLMKNPDEYARVVIQGSKAQSEAEFVIRKAFDSLGNDVIDAAASQLGVPYVWADANPAGSAGGPGAGFDCSGLIMWCYAQVDVFLPHNADQIYHDPTVRHFSERSKVKPGDIVFYHEGRLPPGHADHIALLASHETQIAAPSTGEVVQRQPIDWGHVLTFGFVPAVTGTH